jgi:hypothetical protein
VVYTTLPNNETHEQRYERESNERKMRLRNLWECQLKRYVKLSMHSKDAARGADRTDGRVAGSRRGTQNYTCRERVRRIH